MKVYSYFFLILSLVLITIVSIPGCSLRERESDEPLIRINPESVKYVPPPAPPKELPIFDPKLAFFEFDKSVLTAEARKALIPTASYLKENAKIRLVVEGLCDERGSEEYNQKLGQRRAESAKAFLVSQGIDETRIEAVSLGRIFGTGEKVWANNRRVGFHFIFPQAE